MSIDTLFYGLEAFDDDIVDTAPEDITQEIEEVNEKQQEATEMYYQAKISSAATQIALEHFDEVYSYYNHIAKYGVDRTFLALVNRNNRLGNYLNLTLPSCESVDAIGHPNSQLSLICMEGFGDAIAGFFKWIWEKICAVAKWIKDKIVGFFEWIGSFFKSNSSSSAQPPEKAFESAVKESMPKIKKEAEKEQKQAPSSYDSSTDYESSQPGPAPAPQPPRPTPQPGPAPQQPPRPTPQPGPTGSDQQIHYTHDQIICMIFSAIADQIGSERWLPFITVNDQADDNLDRITEIYDEIAEINKYYSAMIAKNGSIEQFINAVIDDIEYSTLPANSTPEEQAEQTARGQRLNKAYSDLKMDFEHLNTLCNNVVKDASIAQKDMPNDYIFKTKAYISPDGELVIYTWKNGNWYKQYTLSSYSDVKAGLSKAYANYNSIYKEAAKKHNSASYDLHNFSDQITHNALQKLHDDPKYTSYFKSNTPSINPDLKFDAQRSFGYVRTVFETYEKIVNNISLQYAGLVNNLSRMCKPMTTYKRFSDACNTYKKNPIPAIKEIAKKTGMTVTEIFDLMK